MLLRSIGVYSILSLDMDILYVVGIIYRFATLSVDKEERLILCAKKSCQSEVFTEFSPSQCVFFSDEIINGQSLK